MTTSRLISDQGEMELLREGVCKRCKLPVLLARDPGGEPSIFHKEPRCTAFTREPESEYGKSGVEWPLTN